MEPSLKLDPTTIPGPDTIVRHELGNGLVILVRENHTTPAVVVNGLLRAGAIDTGPESAGLAHLTAAALLRGAGRRSFAEIFEALESVGASLSFSTGQHTTEFGGQCLSEDLDLVLDILQAALFEPTFPADQLERLRGQIITGLQIRAHDTRRVASLEFFRLAYPADHPYSRSVDGTIETVSAIAHQQVVDFHRHHYGPRGMILAVVGDVRAATLIQRLEARLGDWSAAQQRPQPTLPPCPPLRAVQERFAPVAGKTQSDIALGLAGPSRSAADYYAARLANSILGVFGLMGRLGTNVRDRQGLAYYAYSELRGGLGPGPWLLSAGVNPVNVARAVAGMRDEIRRLQTEPIPAEELADNKSFRIGSLPLHLETNDGVADVLLDMELYQLGLDYLQRYPDLMLALTAEQVQAAAQRYLDPDVYALAVAGPDNSQGGP